MSIKKAIIEKNDGNEVAKAEYVNLILDDMSIGEICEEDRQFLEGFTETQFLSLNSTGLKSISNLPKMEKLERLELCDNHISTNESTFATISELYPNLKVLKLSNNKLASLDDLKTLQSCSKLESIDISNNPVSKLSSEELTEEAMTKETQDLGKRVREILTQVNVVDGFNREGQEVVSDDEDEDDDEDEEDDDDEDDEEEDGAEGVNGEGDSEDDDEDDEDGEDEEEEDDDEEDEEGTAEKSVGSKRPAAAEGSLEKGGSATKRQNQEISS